MGDCDAKGNNKSTIFNLHYKTVSRRNGFQSARTMEPGIPNAHITLSPAYLFVLCACFYAFFRLSQFVFLTS